MTESEPRRSLTQLLAALPHDLIELGKAEAQSFKIEITGNLKKAGVGIALVAAAAVLLLFMVGALVAAAIAGLSTVWPVWLAALVVAGGILLIAAILALIGSAALKRVNPVPTETLDSIRTDIDVVRGLLPADDLTDRR